MKTKILRLCLTALMLLVTTASYASDAYVDGIYYNLIPKAKTAEVTSGDFHYSGSVVIPSTISHDGIEYKVATIGNNAFRYCTSLTSVTIPETVTIIGEEAFWGCNSLTTVAMPNSVTSIGGDAFRDCISLTDVIIPESITEIGFSNFRGCKSLTSIIIPESVKSIGTNAFYRCESLTSVIIPESVTQIAPEAFGRCKSLTSITIPESVTTIESYTFYDCSSLTSITIPGSVTSIRDEAFKGCTSLSFVTIPKSVKTISKGAFANCKNIETVYCYCQSTPQTFGAVFEGSYVEYATLYVPDETLTEYSKTAPWKDFGNILPLSQISQGIENVYGAPTTVVSYDITGHRINEMQKGVNIIRTEDGKSVKMLKK